MLCGAINPEGPLIFGWAQPSSGRMHKNGEGETMVNPLWPLILRAHKAPRVRELRLCSGFVIIHAV